MKTKLTGLHSVFGPGMGAGMGGSSEGFSPDTPDTPDAPAPSRRGSAPSRRGPAAGVRGGTGGGSRPGGRGGRGGDALGRSFRSAEDRQASRAYGRMRDEQQQPFDFLAQLKQQPAKLKQELTEMSLMRKLATAVSTITNPVGTMLGIGAGMAMGAGKGAGANLMDRAWGPIQDRIEHDFAVSQDLRSEHGLFMSADEVAAARQDPTVDSYFAAMEANTAATMADRAAGDTGADITAAAPAAAPATPPAAKSTSKKRPADAPPAPVKVPGTGVVPPMDAPGGVQEIASTTDWLRNLREANRRYGYAA